MDINDLIDPEMPDHLRGAVQFDKQDFLDKASELGLTPEQVTGLWNHFTPQIASSFGAVHQQFAEQIETVKQESEQKVKETEEAALMRGMEAAQVEADGMTPMEAHIALEKIYNDASHPYNDRKASPQLVELAIAEVNELIRCKLGHKGKVNISESLKEYRGETAPKEVTLGDVAGMRFSNNIMRGDNDSDPNRPAEAAKPRAGDITMPGEK